MPISPIRLAAVLALTLVSACHRRASDQARQQPAVAVAPAELFSPSEPRPLRLSVQSQPLTHGARVTGLTNLPDSTKLSVNIRRGPVSASKEVQVTGGRFSAELFPTRDGIAPPGIYTLEVSSALGNFQLDSVKQQLGSNYQALTGKFVRRTVGPGRTIEYHSQLKIDGPANPDVDRAARKANYRDDVGYSTTSCPQLLDAVARYSRAPVSDARRKRIIRKCLRDAAASRREEERQGLVER
jgi:hypothetical protein